MGGHSVVVLFCPDYVNSASQRRFKDNRAIIEDCNAGKGLTSLFVILLLKKLDQPASVTGHL